MKTEQVAQHTPGPWNAAEFNDDGVWRILDDTGKRVCHIHPCMIKSDAEIDANARLIAAAPDLLEACRMALPILEYRHRHGDDSNDEVDAYSIVKSAITKATNP